MTKKMLIKTPKQARKKIANQYDNDEYDYRRYWQGRDYENASEEMAIKRLLRGKKFKRAADIGGGYGRLCKLLEKYANKVTLVEPSKVQLSMAKNFLKGHKNIDNKLMQADDLKFADGSLDLVTMIRVMHHLPDPTKELSEINRVLAKEGFFILELANLAHARNRLKYLIKRRRLPAKPVDIRSTENRRKEEVAFVNHNPKTVIKQLDEAGFEIVKMLSVSNLRSPGLKKILPKPIMLSAERILQSPFSRIYFGPSVFFLLKKK